MTLLPAKSTILKMNFFPVAHKAAAKIRRNGELFRCHLPGPVVLMPDWLIVSTRRVCPGRRKQDVRDVHVSLEHRHARLAAISRTSLQKTGRYQHNRRDLYIESAFYGRFPAQARLVRGPHEDRTRTAPPSFRPYRSIGWTHTNSGHMRPAELLSS